MFQLFAGVLALYLGVNKNLIHKKRKKEVEENTDSLNKAQAEMALYVPPEILRKVTNKILFLHTSIFLPFVLFISSNPIP